MTRGAFTTSLTLHLLLLSLMMLPRSHKPSEPKGGGAPKTLNVEIMPAPAKQEKTEKAKEEEVKIPDVILKKILQKKLPKKEKCPHWYGGIGLTQDWTTSTVRRVYPGYPAEHAGVMRGDVIISIDGGEITGEVGTITRFSVIRGNSTINFEIVRDKICY